jgi:HSP20 family protein
MTHHSTHAPSSTDLNLVSVHELFEHTQDVIHLISRRAFEKFEHGGHVSGNDRNDWFSSESELLTPVKFHLSESGEQIIARAKLPGFNRQDIKVSIEPHRVTISGKTESYEDRKSGKQTHAHRNEEMIFRVIDLPCAVDFSKAKASFSDGTLEVVMPKADPAKSIRVESKPELSSNEQTSDPNTGGIGAAGSRPVVAEANEPILKARAASSTK